MARSHTRRDRDSRVRPPRSWPVVLAVGVGLGLAAAGLTPWTIRSGPVARAIADQLRDATGLHLAVPGSVTVALLPVPRARLDDVSILDDGGSAVLSGAILRADLSLLPLLHGTSDPSEIVLSDGTIDLSVPSPSGLDRQAVLTRTLRRAIGRATLRAVTLRRFAVTGLPDGPVTDLDLAARWTRPGGRLDVSGGGVWKGERATVALGIERTDALARDEPTRIEIRASGAGASLALAGDADVGGGRFAGPISLDARSLAAVARWTGCPACPEVDLPASLSGDALLSDGRLSWADATLSVGADRYGGTLAVGIEDARPNVRATLAARHVDLSALFDESGRRIGRMLHPAANRLGRADLDIRLSADAVQIGPAATLREAALSLMVTAAKADLVLARSRLAGGTLRGRLSTNLDDDGADLRGQLTLDGAQLDALAASLGAGEVASGQGSLQVAFAIPAGSGDDLHHRIAGRGAVALSAGTLVGANLPNGLKDAEPAAGWKGGRTAFTRGRAEFTLGDGQVRLIGGELDGPGFLARPAGTIDLVGGRFALTLAVGRPPASERDAPPPTYALGLSGPWSAPVLVSEPLPH